MLYIQESLAPGEKILKFTQYHWMYVALSVFSASFFVLMAICFLFVGVIYHYYDIVKVPPWMIFRAAAELAPGDYVKAIWHTNIIIRVCAFLLFLMAIIQVGARILVRITTEMGVTNRRVVYKRGLVSRKVEEMRVDFIDGADVDQTIMGRIFNYGRVKMYGTGTEGIEFPLFMDDPVNFRRAVQAARAVQISKPNTTPGNPAGETPAQHPKSNVSEIYHEAPHPILQTTIKPNGPAISAEDLKKLSQPEDPGFEPPQGNSIHDKFN